MAKTIDEQIAEMDVPSPVNGEDMTLFIRRCMLASAYVGVAYGVTHTPPTVVYQTLPQPDVEDDATDEGTG